MHIFMQILYFYSLLVRHIKSISNSNEDDSLNFLGDLSKYTDENKIDSLVKAYEQDESFKDKFKHILVSRHNSYSADINSKMFNYNLKDSTQDCIKKSIDFINKFFKHELKKRLNLVLKRLTLKEIVKYYVKNIEFNENQNKVLKNYYHDHMPLRTILALDSVQNKLDLCEHFKFILDFKVNDNYIKEFCADLKNVNENLVELNKTNQSIVYLIKHKEDLRTFCVNYIYYLTFVDICDESLKTSKKLKDFLYKINIYDLSSDKQLYVNDEILLKGNLSTNILLNYLIKEKLRKY
ncbi:hypothetical protein EHP00_882 [Ecytonucleospora hepatopenaei]|uniref:Uncharacterized protein n=1 Tax=Ecytonucleospora hepatopenaei TaxID=646526 RepID=A0A1W0E3Y1_9MICR|nr:hypothetical protein EHP00_882 [Ecytonucleospora hepatopenaei]